MVKIEMTKRASKVLQNIIQNAMVKIEMTKGQAKFYETLYRMQWLK